jgi:oligopeptidase B
MNLSTAGGHPRAASWLTTLTLVLPLSMNQPAPAGAQTAAPPLAERHPHPVTLNGETRADDYYWLRDKSDPRVIAYLEAENAYADAATREWKPLRDALYAEMLGRIQQTDLTVPYRRGGWSWYSRTTEGKQYSTYCRRQADDGPEQVVLDLNDLATGHKFMSLGDYEASPDAKQLAYTTDSTGYRQYRLHVKDLVSGATLPDEAERVTSVAWSADGGTLFYTQEDPVSKRSDRLYRHPLGGPHELLYQELDERFEVHVGLTRSGEWIVQTRSSHTTSEVAVLPAARPGDDWTLIVPRRQDIEYYVDHRGGEFWIRTNDAGRNYRVVTAPVATPDPEHWKEVVAHQPDVMITGLECFRDRVVLSERERALPQIVVLDPGTGETRRATFPEAAYTVSPAANEQFDATAFRYGYQSFVTPPSVYDLDFASFESRLLKRQEVLGGWDPSRYVIERIEATARDGTKVPLTLLHRKDTPRDGSAPCLLYSYGSYGIPSNVTFNSNRFSLVDRGMVYALAHIRGGGDLGKPWHDAGRMQNKMKTFTDFVDCAQSLIAGKWTSADRLVIQGGSAGGLLVGAVTNLRPDLFKGVLAQVPFVDVINTMLDESLPLTVGEFEEWGNPKLAEQYAWIRQYSPYDNLAAKAYPAMLVKTSLNDSQVGYWEPAKYVAKLRRLRTDSNPLLFKCNMGAGHGGASGRYDALHDVAFDYAWVLNTVGLGSAKPLP